MFFVEMKVYQQCNLTFQLSTCCDQDTENTNWIRERFNASGPIREDTAISNLPRGATKRVIDQMIIKLTSEREQVRMMIKDEVESLMRLGAEVTKMTYKCKNTNAERQCITPKNMRLSYIYNGSLTNVKRIHWIFHKLPLGTHQDVLPQRRSHMDMVVKKVECAMNILWAEKKEGDIELQKLPPAFLFQDTE